MTRTLRPATRRRLAQMVDPSSIERIVAGVLYSMVGRHLPWSPRPFGRWSRRFRAVLASRMLDACGIDVNVEHGARFGSGRGIRLGDRSDIGLDAIIIGPVEIGDDVMMGPRCILLASMHGHADTSRTMNTQGLLEDRPIVIGNDVWIGAASVILPGRRIGHGSIVGAGSVVTRDVPPFSVVGGNPATVISHRQPGAVADAPANRIS